jgi:flagellar motor protein MotB
VAGRFQGRSNPQTHGGESTGSSRGDGYGEWWAAVAVIAIASMAVVSLTGSAGSFAPKTNDPTPEILSTLRPAQRTLDAVESAFGSLCQEPVLLALELEPDCETGVITISEKMFVRNGGAKLNRMGKEDVSAAMTTYLAMLRRLPALWDHLDAIEIRGHSDPRAIRNAYSTNMVGSQQRALGVLLFLVSPSGLANKDREDLQRLGSVSGVSFSRPPADCPEPKRECYSAWRRVEIRPVLSESYRRSDLSQTVQDVRSVASLIRSDLDRQSR